MTDVDVLSSFARRVGDSVEVVLLLPGDAPVDPRDHPRIWVRFEPDTESANLLSPVGDPATLAFRAPAEVTEQERADGPGWRIHALVPAESLPDGLWKLRVRPGKDALLFLRARLLTSSRQPVALLPGPRPGTSMAPPAPRQSASAPTRRRPGSS